MHNTLVRFYEFTMARLINTAVGKFPPYRKIKSIWICYSSGIQQTPSMIVFYNDAHDFCFHSQLSWTVNNPSYIKLNAGHCPLHKFRCGHWSEETLNSLHKTQSVGEIVVSWYLHTSCSKCFIINIKGHLLSSALEFSKFSLTHGWVRGEMLLAQAILSLTQKKTHIEICCMYTGRYLYIHCS